MTPNDVKIFELGAAGEASVGAANLGRRRRQRPEPGRSVSAWLPLAVIVMGAGVWAGWACNNAWTPEWDAAAERGWSEVSAVASGSVDSAKDLRWRAHNLVRTARGSLERGKQALDRAGQNANLALREARRQGMNP